MCAWRACPNTVLFKARTACTGEERGCSLHFPCAAGCPACCSLLLTLMHDFTPPVMVLTLLSAGWELGWCVPPSSSHPLCLCSCCQTGISHHGWGTQLSCCWADFPSTALADPSTQECWCWQSTGGTHRERWRTLKRKGSNDLFGQQLLNCTLWLGHPLLTSFVPHSRDFYQDLGVLLGSISHPFPSPTTAAQVWVQSR